MQQALSEHPEDISYEYLAIELLISAGELSAAKERFENLSQEKKDTEEVKHIVAMLYFADILEATNHDANYEHQLEKDPNDADALYHITAKMALNTDYDEALTFAWRLFQKHMAYRSGEPKIVLLRLFDLLGKSDTRAQAFRRKMFNFLH